MNGREMNAIKSKLAGHLNFIIAQANRVKEEVNNSERVKAIKQKVSYL